MLKAVCTRVRVGGTVEFGQTEGESQQLYPPAGGKPGPFQEQTERQAQARNVSGVGNW